LERAKIIERTTRGRLHRLRMGEMSTVAVHLFYGRLSGQRGPAEANPHNQSESLFASPIAGSLYPHTFGA
jgi:hypothetical protein